MDIIPGLYLASGSCVSHYKGDPAQATRWSTDPLSIARRFEKQGAKKLAVIDLDQSPKNRALAKIIVKNTTLAIQYLEGVRTQDDCAQLFAAGVARCGLNQFSEELAEDVLHQWGPEKIIFTIQTERELVSRPALAAQDKLDVALAMYGEQVSKRGFQTIVFRDTKAEGTLHPNFDGLEQLHLALPQGTRLIVCGGVGKISDLELLEKNGAKGVIISRAFLEGTLSLSACIQRFGSGL